MRSSRPSGPSWTTRSTPAPRRTSAKRSAGTRPVQPPSTNSKACQWRDEFRELRGSNLAIELCLAARPRGEKAGPMRLLLGTRKGAWIFERGATDAWATDGPMYLGHIVNHVVMDPRDG